MENIDFNKIKKVHLIGIGGVSMSAIAYMLRDKGIIVTGSDTNAGLEVHKLMTMGMDIGIGHSKKNIKDDMDIVVYSKAIHPDNEEYKEALKKGIKLVSRSEMLGAIMKEYKRRICIAGTHGKTTTTSIISKIIIDEGMEPTINVGGALDIIDGNTHIGKNKNMFIVEACEYTNSFLDFYPTDVIITNIDVDHLDFFKDIDDIRKSFKKFIDLIPNGGKLFINYDIKNVKDLICDTKAEVFTFGENEKADYYYKNCHYDEKTNQIYDIYFRGKYVGEIVQKLIGKHNADNFIGAFALLHNKGISFDRIKESMKDFTGAHRRLEIKGKINGVTFIDDYAHHPSEIRASLSALKELKYNKMYLIFQPHTFSRTKALFDEFVEVLGDVNNLILTKIYPAREKDTGEISSKDIAIKIQENSRTTTNLCKYLCEFNDIIEFLKTNLVSGDMVVSMGAGNITDLYDKFCNK